MAPVSNNLAPYDCAAGLRGVLWTFKRGVFGHHKDMVITKCDRVCGETSMVTKEQIVALNKVVDTVLEAIGVGGDLGAPGGVLYAGLMTGGCTLNQFQGVMGVMERTGLVIKDGDCYYLTEKGQARVARQKG